MATSFLWSLAGVLIKWVSLPALAVAGYRSAIALPVIFIFFGRRALDFSRPQILGALGYAGTVILFVCANKLTTAGNAILLQYTAPVYVALMSGWLLKERVRWFDWASIGLALAGMSLFFMGNLSPRNMLGNLIAVITGFTFASLILFLRKQKDGNPAGSVILGNFLTALICLPWMIGGTPLTGGDWAGILLLGIFQLGLSYLLYSLAIKGVTAMEGVLIPVLEPLFNPLWAFLFINERMGGWALAGGAVVVSAVVFRGAMGSQSRD